ncbi:MAG: SH3 domain-containing protein [Alphaproteobacteria bacterium]|nr:SH3 domain-containing protein [Alphaproteobacteria bacterium]
MRRWIALGVGVLFVLCGLFVFKERILDRIGSSDGLYLFLRSNNVNGRAGPSKDYPCICNYRMRFLPLKIIAEQEEWFLLEDWLGMQSWIHTSLVSKRARFVLVQNQNSKIYTDTNDSSAHLAVLDRLVCVRMLRTSPAWVRVQLDKKYGSCVGWMRAQDVWGI